VQTGELSKLVTYIEENLRASPTSGVPFVDSRHHQERLMSRQNHVVFGRRGAGKTTLVKSAADSEDHLTVYLNLEDYKDITFPNIVIHILVELFTLIEKRIKKERPWYRPSLSAWRIRRSITGHREKLRAYLHEPDEETQTVSEKEGYSQRIGASATSRVAEGRAAVSRDRSREVKREIPRNKLEFLRLELTTYKKLISAISAFFGDRPIFLVLDDFYFVPKGIQPSLIDYFHRLTKGTELFLKIATIKHRSKLYRRAGAEYVGVELAHDVFEVDMDYTLDNFVELQEFMRQLLDNAVEKSGAKGNVSDLFAGDGFSQLCLASGGVPRDFLSVFVTLAARPAEEGPQIGKVQVTEVAIANVRNKLESMRRDSGEEDAVLEEYLHRIKAFVYAEKRTNAFLVAKDDLDHDAQVRQAIRELVDLRLIHLVDNNTSRAPSDGRRYEAYILDIGLYDNPRPRSFAQIEPGQRDDKARKDALRAAPVLEAAKLREPSPKKPVQLELGLSCD
jgi:hypothetical protein